MKRREILSKTIAGIGALTAGGAMVSRPALADHRLAPSAHRLDQATQALLDSLIGTAHHQDRGEEHEADEEVAAIMAAGALQGQAHAIHELIERGDPDARLQVAARMLDRQLASSERRILHAHITRDVRQRFQQVQQLSESLLRQLGGRSDYHSREGYGASPSDRYRDDRYRDDRPREVR